MSSCMQDSNYVYVNMEYSKLEPLGAFFLITFIGIMAIQVSCHNRICIWQCRSVEVDGCFGGKLLYQIDVLKGESVTFLVIYHNLKKKKMSLSCSLCNVISLLQSLQFVGMLLHRLMTLGHIVASTKLGLFGARKHLNPEEFLNRHGVEGTKFLSLDHPLFLSCVCR